MSSGLAIVSLLFTLLINTEALKLNYRPIKPMKHDPNTNDDQSPPSDLNSLKEDECEDQYDNIGNCYTKIHVCAGFYDWEWKYYGYAATNGTTGPTTPHYDSSTGAGTHAVQSLFELLPNSVSDCNCGYKNNYVVGQCTIDIKECFRFNSSTDVENKEPDYMAWVTPVDDTSITGFYCCDYNETLTAEYAIKNLEQKDYKCFI